jgi:NADH-quinone oxidoreductase subunit J
MEAVLFYGLAAVALLSALVVVVQRNAIYSAFALIVTFCSLSGIYGLLGSPFIAVLQIIVYAGAIMVLFLFVLMLLNVRSEGPTGERARVLRGVALALVVLLALQLGMVIAGAGVGGGPAEYDASTIRIARILFSASQVPSFLYAFEAAAVLILAALVGAVVLAKKEL